MNKVILLIGVLGVLVIGILFGSYIGSKSSMFCPRANFNDLRIKLLIQNNLIDLENINDVKINALNQYQGDRKNCRFLLFENSRKFAVCIDGASFYMDEIVYGEQFVSRDKRFYCCHEASQRGNAYCQNCCFEFKDYRDELGKISARIKCSGFLSSEESQHNKLFDSSCNDRTECGVP